MKPLTLGLLALLASGTLQAAEQLHVKAGQTLTLDDKKSVLVLDSLELDDNSTLIVPSSMPQIQIQASKAIIGQHVRILAVGANGAPGQAGASQTGQAARCEPGANGGNGSPGNNGSDGVEVNLTLRIAAIGSLAIDTHGGAGGVGGAGGMGQKGGEFDNCDAPPGGEGGRGGDGGDGGNGGHVRVLYSLIPGAGLSDGIGNRIQVDASGGKGAAGGTGGKGGVGVEGRFINMKSLSGSRKWVGGGRTGAEGSAGKSGRDGSKGQVLVQQDLRSRMDEMVQKQTAQVEAMGAQLTQTLAQDKARAEASTGESLKTIAGELDALKQRMNSLASQQMVQKQVENLDAATKKLSRALEAIQKRLDHMDARMNKLAADLKAPKPAASKNP